MAKDWAFLNKRFTISLSAGQRYYDVPSGLDLERIECVKSKYGGSFYDVTRGIDLEDYNIHDSEADTPERSSPVLKWDFQFTTTPQIELWPIPDADTQKLYIEGMHAISPLVNDSDVCLLDSEIIVLYAAAELLQSVSAKDADAKRDLAAELQRLHGLRGNSGGSTPVTIGAGTNPNNARSTRAVVRISS